MSTEPASVPGEVIFVGACILKGGKLGSQFIPFDCLDQLGDQPEAVVDMISSPFDIRPNLVVGGVYEAPIVREEDRIRRLGARTFKRRVDHPIVKTWELRHRATELEVSAGKAEKKARSNPVVAREIEALAALYYRTPTRQRYTFEAAIIGLIREEAGKLSAARIRENAERLGLSGR
jgi:hypothetical protein